MSFWDRVGRVFEALDNEGRYGADAFGREGVMSGRRSMTESGLHVWFDPIVRRRKGDFFSIPAVIWAEGSVFAVDFKRWKGKLKFADVTRSVKVRKRFLFWEYEDEVSQVVGVDRSNVVKAKEGNYGEDTFYRTFRNPLGKPRAYSHALKEQLSRKERRWRGLPIYPVVAFTGDELDLGSVGSIEEGIVLLEDLPELVRWRRNERFARRPSRWIVDGLNSLPTWDRLITRTGDVFQGELLDSTLGITTFQGDDLLRLAEVTHIDVNRDGIFSERDDLVAHLPTGDTVEGWCKWKTLRLNERGKTVEHRVRNLSQILVGISGAAG
jgi:hypothetical protein